MDCRQRLILEDGDNELPDLYRPTLHRMYTRLLELREHIEAMTSEVEVLVKQHPICSRLTALEGIGPIGALLLYATLGSGTAFSGSREFAAYLGLAPRQYSLGHGDPGNRVSTSRATEGGCLNVLQTKTLDQITISAPAKPTPL